MIQTFSQAFDPWKSTKYSDEQRIQGLTAILKESAELGIWLFSQGSELRFRWSSLEKATVMAVMVSPSLEKVTDEKGQPLQEPQNMIKAAVQEVG